MTWRGDYYAPNSRTGRSVQVTVEPAGLRFHLDGFVLWPYSELRLTQGFSPGETVRMVRGQEPEAAALVIADRGILLETVRYAPHLKQVQADGALPRALMFFGAAALLAVVGAGVLFYLGIPALGETLAKVIPTSAEERLGRLASEQIAPEAKQCKDSELNSAVQAIMQRLLAAAPPHPYQFHTVVTDEPQMNALAAPGGYVVIFRGLVREADSPEEVAGVLAHEIQHVLERHATQALLRKAGAAAVLSVLFGDTGGMMGLAGDLAGLQFDRDDESEADRKGLELMERAEIDSEAMIRIFEKLMHEGGDVPSGVKYLSTHPDLQERIAQIEAMRSRNVRAVPIKVRDWHRVSELCD